MYLYRAVAKVGQTVDFYLSEHRDPLAAKRFFRRAVLRQGPPKKYWMGTKPRTRPWTS